MSLWIPKQSRGRCAGSGAEGARHAPLSPTPASPASGRRLALPAICAATVALAATAAAGAAGADDPPKPRLIVVPPQSLGDPHVTQERRILRSAQDQFTASSVFDVGTDRDKVTEKTDPKKGGPKPTAASKRIEAADAVRQEGIDLQAEGKHGDALDKLRDAATLYEKAYLELVDYSKLADAYMRAGVCAHYAGQGAGAATRWFELGIAIEPTLVIDRRKQDKALLDLFDSTHERMSKAPKFAIELDGPPTAGIEAFVDGVKLVSFPGKSPPIMPGTHYAQIRGEGHVPWGTVVHLGKKDAKVTVKITAIKVEERKPEVPLTIDALADCARVGAFAMPLCKAPAAKLAKQTGANWFWFGLLRFDRFNRPGVVPFLMDAAAGLTVQLKPIDLQPDLGDLNRKMTEHEAEVSAAVASFPKARALTKQPSAYSGK